MHKLQESVITLWTLVAMMRAVLLSLGVFIYESVAGVDSILPLPYPTTTIAFFTFFGIVSFVVPRLRYKFWSFEIRDKEVILERGILTRVRTIAPITRIQHTDVSQGPFERLFDLAHLSLYTAGTRGADVVIPGLPLPYAEELRDYLKNYVLEDSV